MIPAEAGDRNRQFLPVEVLAVAAPVRLRAPLGAITGQGGIEVHIGETNGDHEAFS
jgi:hypothetical protein